MRRSSWVERRGGENSATWNFRDHRLMLFTFHPLHHILHSRQNLPLQPLQRHSIDTMGKNNKKKSAKKSSDQGGDLLYVNPSRIRYQHSRIRPTFSGCGRNVMDTLDEIRRGDLNPYDLPVIQVCKWWSDCIVLYGRNAFYCCFWCKLRMSSLHKNALLLYSTLLCK